MKRRTVVIIGFSSALGLVGCAGDDGAESGGGTGGTGGTTTGSASGSQTGSQSQSQSGSSESASQSGSGNTATTMPMTSQGTSDATTATGTADTGGSGTSDTSDAGSGTSNELCCDPLDLPPCIEGATCCDTGEWMCNDGPGTVPCDEGELCGDCQPAGFACSQAMGCCGDLMCCSIGPVGGEMACMEECNGVSDRNVKENFANVDAHEVLDQVAALEITTWNYRWDDASVRHLGPMAQDFKAKFGVGKTDTRILQVDGDGIALSAIQALHSDMQQLRAENEELRNRLEVLSGRLEPR